MRSPSILVERRRPRGDAVETLSRSRHVVIPGGTHIHRSACLDRVVEEFLATAEPERVDASCLEDAARPPFFLGDPPPAPQ